MENALVLTVGSSDVTLLVTDSSAIEKGTVVECWAPDSSFYIARVRNIAGNILEVDKNIGLKGFVDKVPNACLVVNSSKGEVQSIQDYINGRYNDDIKEIMKRYNITDYELPDSNKQKVFDLNFD